MYILIPIKVLKLKSALAIVVCGLVGQNGQNVMLHVALMLKKHVLEHATVPKVSLKKSAAARANQKNQHVAICHHVKTVSNQCISNA